MPSTVDEIVSQILELSLEEKSNDPVRNLYSVCLSVDNKIESIICKLREQERRRKADERYKRTNGKSI